MAGKYTITEGWAFAGSTMGVEAAAIVAISAYARQGGYMDASDKSRTPAPQIETPQAAAMVLSLMVPTQQTMVPTETGFVWNLPATSSLDTIRAGLAKLGIELPDDARFGRDVMCGLIEAATRTGGQAWLLSTFERLTIWQGSTRAALRMHEAPSVMFELGHEYHFRHQAVAKREVRVDVPARIIIEMGKFVRASRAEAARLGCIISTETTLRGLEPPTPPSPDPLTDSGQTGTTAPENTKADRLPPLSASASRKVARSASRKPEQPHSSAVQVQGYPLFTKEGSTRQGGSFPNQESSFGNAHPFDECPGPYSSRRGPIARPKASARAA